MHGQREYFELQQWFCQTVQNWWVSLFA